MQITFDSAKRASTLVARGLDFADAVEVFANEHYDIEDDREDYGETRMLTFGILRGRLVALVWTQRADSRRIISMRHANEREKARYEARLARP